MRIFIADDSEILRSRLVSILSEIEGLTVVGQAENSTEAIKAIEKLDPDVVIMDIRMPNGDGISALNIIKKELNIDPIVIMFTNYPYLQYRKKCLEAGADYFFFKSTEFESLIELMRNMVLPT